MTHHRWRYIAMASAFAGLNGCEQNPVDQVTSIAHGDHYGPRSRDASVDVLRPSDAAPAVAIESGVTSDDQPQPQQSSLAPTAISPSDLPLQTDFPAEACPALDLLIDMRAVDEYETDRGVLIKVLARPEFTEANRTDPNNMTRVPPENWDRAEFPEGACVVQLRGLDAECYTNDQSMALYEPADDGGSTVGQASYHARRWVSDYDLCDWPVPGCPRAEWDTFRGRWWYLTPRTDDALLVVCAPSCEGFFRAPITLQLRPDGPTGLCDEP